LLYTPGAIDENTGTLGDMIIKNPYDTAPCNPTGYRELGMYWLITIPLYTSLVTLHTYVQQPPLVRFGQLIL